MTNEKKNGSQRQETADIPFFEKMQSLHLFLYPVIGVILFTVLYSNVEPDTFDAKLFSVSDQTIYAPVTVVDKEMTEKRREEAAESVEDQYVLKKNMRTTVWIWSNLYLMPSWRLLLMPK